MLWPQQMAVCVEENVVLLLHSLGHNSKLSQVLGARLEGGLESFVFVRLLQTAYMSSPCMRATHSMILRLGD